jgi:hypothetical protein
MIDLPKVNRLMDGVEYIGGDPARGNFWNHLINEIRNLKREDEALAIPTPNEPYAWRRTYQIYRQLRAREKQPDPAAVEAVDHSSAIEHGWNLYVGSLSELQGLIARGEINQTAVEYLGLQSGDTGPAITNLPDSARWGGKRHDWMEVAGRVGHALERWRNMSREERAQIPFRVAVLRLDRRVRGLEEAFAEFLNLGKDAA